MSFIGDFTGGLIGESSAESAADAAAEASAIATAKATGYIDDASAKIEDIYAPYQAGGTDAFGNIIGMESPDAPELQQFEYGAEDFEESPGYQYRLSQSLEAADRISRKNRGLSSGGRIGGAIRTAGGEASAEYANAWNRAFQTNLANNATLAQSFGLASQKYGMDFGKEKYVSDVGFGAAQKVGDYGYRGAVDKGNLALGHAANTTAADMFQAQTKSQFVSDAMGMAGSWLGGK